MSNFQKPVASALAGVEFGSLSPAEIKALSVKRIHNSITLDSFNNPVPNGLYDPALGAWGDNVLVLSKEVFVEISADQRLHIAVRHAR